MEKTGLEVLTYEQDEKRRAHLRSVLNYLLYALPEYVTARILTNKWSHEDTHHKEKPGDNLMQKQHDIIDKYHEKLEYFKTSI